MPFLFEHAVRIPKPSGVLNRPSCRRAPARRRPRNLSTARRAISSFEVSISSAQIKLQFKPMMRDQFSIDRHKTVTAPSGSSSLNSGNGLARYSNSMPYCSRKSSIVRMTTSRTNRPGRSEHHSEGVWIIESTKNSPGAHRSAFACAVASHEANDPVLGVFNDCLLVRQEISLDPCADCITISPCAAEVTFTFFFGAKDVASSYTIEGVIR